MATRFETKVINVKNLTIDEVVGWFLKTYNEPAATYAAMVSEDNNQIRLSRSGENIDIKFTEPMVLVPGISSLEKVTIEVKEISRKQTYATCSDIPGIRDIHVWIQYLPGNEEGSVKFRAVVELDIAWYNPVGKMIKMAIEDNRRIIDKEIDKFSDQLEEELVRYFANKTEEEVVAAENA